MTRTDRDRALKDRARLLLLLSLMAMLPVVTEASPAEANTGSVEIYAVYYDPIAGADPLTNYYFNKEYVTIRNTSTTTRNLYAYTIRDAYRASCSCTHIYKFSSNFYLGGGRSVRIHTGRGTNSSTDRYWGKTYYVWGDDSDTATLKNRYGTTVWTCSWTSTNTSPRYC